MRRSVVLLLLRASLSAPYARLDEHPQAWRVNVAAEACSSRLGHALGSEFMGCVVDELLAVQKAARASASDDYFPVVRHNLDPWEPAADQRGRSGSAQSDLLKDLLRNHSCNVEDGGSQPVRSMTWEYQPPDPCGDMDDSAPPPPPFVYKKGFLPAGNDLAGVSSGGSLTEKEAQEACLAHEQCAGFTFSSSVRGRSKRHTMHFKSASSGISVADDWHTFKRKSMGQDCRPGKRRPPPPPLRLRVDVLRESPPVYLVHDFATAKECEYMMNITVPHMAPSVVYGGNTAGSASSYRQSFSVNMYADWDDETNTITRMVRRKFAFAREVAEYEELVEGEGQEPLNSVYYKNLDDQYRPHCDGQCHGGRYRKGERIATSLTYCAVADKGGYTMFSRTGLKVVPQIRQMLFFGYKLPPAVEDGMPLMDKGHTEHTGCPLREGSSAKWIATMWYREGMTAERGWEQFRGAF